MVSLTQQCCLASRWILKLVILSLYQFNVYYLMLSLLFTSCFRTTLLFHSFLARDAATSFYRPFLLGLNALHLILFYYYHYVRETPDSTKNGEWLSLLGIVVIWILQ